MTKNYWVRQIWLRNLNKDLTEKVKKYFGQVWTEDLKKTITKLALQFMVDNKLDDKIQFAVILEKGKANGITGAVDIFRGIKIIT